jgi:hypothetical protein
MLNSVASNPNPALFDYLKKALWKKFFGGSWTKLQMVILDSFCHYTTHVFVKLISLSNSKSASHFLSHFFHFPLTVIFSPFYHGHHFLFSNSYFGVLIVVRTLVAPPIFLSHLFHFSLTASYPTFSTSHKLPFSFPSVTRIIFCS